MADNSFRGASGEVVRGFLTPATWLTSLPVMFCLAGLGAGASWAAMRLQIPGTLVVPFVMTTFSPVVGIFALAGRRGSVHAGLMEAMSVTRGLGGFVLRMGALSVFWGVPLALLGGKLTGLGTSLLMAKPEEMMKATWTALAFVALAVAAPALSLLVATRAGTLGEAFSPQAWGWLARSRREDLAAFFAAYAGGMLLFSLVTIPACALLIPIFRDISPQLAQDAFVIVVLLPCAAAPVLLGRLAGAFVLADDAVAAAGPQRVLELVAAPRAAVKAASRHHVATPAPTRPLEGIVASSVAGNRTHGALAGVPRGTLSVRVESPTAMMAMRGTSGLPLGVALARAHQLGETDVSMALEEIDGLLALHPRNPAVAGERARLLRRAGREEEARECAGSAIRWALLGGAGPIAQDLYMAFAAEAGHLGLDPQSFEQLGRILCTRHEFAHAAWCFRAVEAFGGDPVTAQRGVLNVAAMALTGEQADASRDACEAFLATWPDSPLAPAAREALQLALRNTPVGV